MRGSMVSPPCSTTNSSALHRGLACGRVVLAIGQAGDEVTGIAQGAQLAAAGQRDGIIKGSVPALGSHQWPPAFVIQVDAEAFGQVGHGAVDRSIANRAWLARRAATVGEGPSSGRRARPIRSPVPVRPDVGSAPTARAADEARLDVREPDVVRPAFRA